MHENTESTLGVEKEFINNIFSSHENTDLIDKHKPQKKAKSKIVPFSKFNPEDLIFCTLDTNPESMIINQEEQAVLNQLGLDNDFDEELFEIKSPDSTMFEPSPREVQIFDIKISTVTTTKKFRRKNNETITTINPLSHMDNLPKNMGTGKLKALAHR